ncbi:ribosomal protein S2, flavodoxin-like domain-containing protein [Pestalotiopsis sp. NC0098]|nr:ribosomal protein S2, flavodoxin-like domain-containing protein [Pestalotiopsis sp. NC0098]
MIIREFGVRQGRKALATSLRQGPRCMRQLSSLSSETPGAVADPAIDGSLQKQSTKPKRSALFMQTVKPARKRPVAVDTTKKDYEDAKQMRMAQRAIGTDIEHSYSPSDVFSNPPGPKDVTLELLMASQAHMGHHTSVWNPANARYIYGVRQGIHIISLEETAAHLRRAARVVEEVAYHGGLILFVGTRPGQTQIVAQAAKLAGACHLFSKWTPGTITNSDKILPGMPMKIVDQHDNELHGFKQHLMSRRALVPDLVVCLNPLENAVMLRECGLANVPTIGVVDTNTEPTWVTYAIPANDDSFRCLAVIGSVLGRAGEAGQKRRLEAAQKGIVKWETAAPIRRFQDSELTRNQWRRRAIAENKAEEAQALGVEGEAAPAAPEDELSIRQAMRELDDEDMLDLLQGEASGVEARGPGQKYEA